jgi:hypothetical protein
MKIASPRPAIYEVTLHAYELSALVAAARWVVGGAEGEVDPEAREQLRVVLDGYDAERRRRESRAKASG